MNTLANRIEALLFTRNSGLSVNDIAQALNTDKTAVVAALNELMKRYESSAISVVEIASGWRLQVRPDYFSDICALNHMQPVTYSRAFWETLAYIVYHQPVTRAEIDRVRGVTTNTRIYQQLFDLGWIVVAGQKEVVGRPDLLATTRAFLDDFGVQTLAELPPLSAIEQFIVAGDDNEQKK